MHAGLPIPYVNMSAPLCECLQKLLIMHERTSPLCGWVCRGFSHVNILAPYVNMYQDSQSPIWIYGCVNVQVPYAGGYTKALVNVNILTPCVNMHKGFQSRMWIYELHMRVHFSTSYLSIWTTRITCEYTSQSHIWIYELHMRIHAEAFNPMYELLGFSSSPNAFNLVYECTNLIWIRTKSFQSYV